MRLLHDLTKKEQKWKWRIRQEKVHNRTNLSNTRLR